MTSHVEPPHVYVYSSSDPYIPPDPYDAIPCSHCNVDEDLNLEELLAKFRAEFEARWARLSSQRRERRRKHALGGGAWRTEQRTIRSFFRQGTFHGPLGEGIGQLKVRRYLRHCEDMSLEEIRSALLNMAQSEVEDIALLYDSAR